ncbi:unnamed protein product [Durusdinium trenchii]|uniref:C2H2-type domain-containing protein n=1 Tax=Durusdinium trenchii TaxID=1381693 RepID=A0ABP0J9C7_9DINO
MAARSRHRSSKLECRTPAQDLAQLRTLLQSFFDARGADLAVSDADAENVLACGQDREALTTTLHTLLQAGLVYADSGMHAARRLMEQWLAYHAVCTQGPGRKLREGLPQDANPQSLELASSAPGSRPAVGLPRRLRGKQPDPHRLNPSTPVTSPQLPQTHADVAENPMQAVNDIFSLRIWPREDGNEDPRARRDLDIQQAAELLTESPTLPASTTTETARDRAYLLPPYHCAFRSCVFTCSQQSELEQHLVQTHQSLLLPLSLHPHVTHTSLRQALYETYLHLLQYRCQQLAPVANCSVDRRCLKQFRKSLTEGTLGAAVCFVCARRYPFMPACRNTCITWVQARDPKTRLVLGQTSEKLEEILGWKTFEQRYILPLDESTQSSLRSEMDSWTCHFRSAEYDVMLVACSEDKRCSAVPPCRSNRMCALCEVPLCKACQDSLYGCQRKPAEVAVLIKVGKKQDLDVKQHIVHQAVVRRRVVVALIAAMVARGHPAYRNVDMVAVTERATMLPEHDVPQEVVAMLENDDSLSHIQRQKAANAVNTVMTEAQITREFARMLKPNAVVLEKTCAGFQDVNAQQAQVSRDWVFGFTAWNLLFRSSLNLSRTTDAYSQTYYDEDEQAWIRPTESHIEAAAKQLLASVQERIQAAEATWPEHEHDTVMTAAAGYQLQPASRQDADTEAAKWKQQYLEEDVVALQLLKQHHYHPYNEAAQARIPLSGCQKSDRPGVCKSDFPRTSWLCSVASVLCPCQLKKFGMPGSGRKNRLGSLHGPCGNEWLNGCAPAMLAGLRGANCDVQVPYRLPYACDICGTRLEPEARRAIALAAQRAQDAQTGYCADYCSKNQPMGFAEIKEFQKGHDHLHAQVRGSSVDCIGKRHASRFLSDAYLKGVVRGQVECCNLRAHHRDATVVSAERISTTAFESFPGGAFVDVVQHLHAIDPSAPSSKVSTRWTRRHSSGVRHLAYVNVAEVYGHRPALSEIWWLSPYEFVASWRVTLACVPATKREWETLDETGWDVTITAAGRRHIQKQNDPDKKLNLQPGAHYTLRLDASNNRILLDRTTATETLRHRCYLQRRTRPCCPHFENSPVPQHTVDQAEPNARLTLTYFRAWTLNARNASATVPFAGHLKGSQQTWLQALQAWLTRLPCEETKRYVGNFLSVYRVRPVDTDAANSDDEAADEPLLVTAAALPTVLTTSFRQTGKQNQTKAASKADAAALASYKAAVAQADVIWQPPARAVADNMPNPYESIDPREVQTMLKTAKANRKAKAPSYEHASETAAGTWQAQAHCVSKEVDEFLVDIRQQHKCNTEQLQFLQTVCERIRAEALTGQDRGGAAETNTEPLRWALHGGPGTGKSYVLNLLRQDLFQQRLNWQQGKEFQVVAFQAVNAEPLDGDTIHAALGLAWHGNDSSVDAQRILDLASSAVQWRWLLLDEISMVSAEMLARLEARCRQLVLDLSATKYGKHSDGRIAPLWWTQCGFVR